MTEWRRARWAVRAIPAVRNTGGRPVQPQGVRITTSDPDRVRRWHPGRLYPLLFAGLPFVHVVASNPGQSRLTTLALVVLGLWAGFGLLYLVVGWSLRNRASAPLTPLIVLAFVAWFYLNPVAQHLVERATGASVSPLLPIPMGLLLAVGALSWIGRHPRIRDGANAVLPMIAVLLLAWSAIRIASNEIHTRRAIARSALVAELAAPVRAAPIRSLWRDKPDIYLIVLDEYANSAVLRELFGWANKDFEDSLRTLGFTIPTLVRSNYAQTTLSIPSLLNFAYLNQLTDDVGRRSNDRSVPNYLLENNRLVRFLKAQGYRFVFFPSEWWRATDHNRHADQEFRVDGGPSLQRALAASELEKLLWRFTLLGATGSPFPVQAEYIKRTFNGIRRLETKAAPTFVFAHFILPHSPYVFDARCESKVAQFHGMPDRRYLDQVRCANALILDLVGTLVSRPGRPRIILLQGDHGSGMRGYNTSSSERGVTPAQAEERFGAFGAYYLPRGGGRLFADTVTVVNVLRKVLRYYFGAVLPDEIDRFYMSMEYPFDLVQVDPTTLR
jgi:hypothetical protein